MKRNLLKVIGISFLLYVVLSWLIPSGVYSGGKLTTSNISPVGLGDLFNEPISALITFILYGVIFSAIGGFYGVVEKTGALDKVVSKTANKYEGKENRFLVIVVILLVLLSSLTGLVVPLFVLVPLFAGILFKMNYDKVTVLASTVGSLLIGNVVSTYGFNITGYTKNLLSLDMNSQIIAKVILLILVTVLFIFTLIFSSKKSNGNESKNKKAKEVSLVQDKDEVKEIKPKKNTAKTSSKANNSKSKKTTKKASKSNTKALAVSQNVKKVSKKSEITGRAFIIILSIMLIIAFVSMYNWYYSFGVEVFNDAYEAIMGVKIKGFAIFENLLGGIKQFGYWSNVEFSSLLIVTSMLIAFIYKLTINEYVESFIAGVKKWLPTAIYATLANVILVILYSSLQSGSGTLIDTINAKIFGLVDGFNPIITGVSALISSFFFNDLYYLLADLSSFVSGFKGTDIEVAGLIIQSIYGIAMLIFPTSVSLIVGLSLFDVSYKDWIKYIWRFVLITLLLVLLVCGIITLL